MAGRASSLMMSHRVVEAAGPAAAPRFYLPALLTADCRLLLTAAA
jgi:hypothetical protein